MLFPDVAVVISVSNAHGDEVLDVSLSDLELEVVGEHGLQVGHVDVVLVLLIENLEALVGLLLSTVATLPSVPEGLALWKGNSSSLKDVLVVST